MWKSWLWLHTEKVRHCLSDLKLWPLCLIPIRSLISCSLGKTTHAALNILFHTYTQSLAIARLVINSKRGEVAGRRNTGLIFSTTLIFWFRNVLAKTRKLLSWLHLSIHSQDPSSVFITSTLLVHLWTLTPKICCFITIAFKDRIGLPLHGSKGAKICQISFFVWKSRIGFCYKKELKAYGTHCKAAPVYPQTEMWGLTKCWFPRLTEKLLPDFPLTASVLHLGNLCHYSKFTNICLHTKTWGIWGW